MSVGHFRLGRFKYPVTGLAVKPLERSSARATVDLRHIWFAATRPKERIMPNGKPNIVVFSLSTRIETIEAGVGSS